MEAVVPEVSDFRIRPYPPGLQSQTEKTNTADESLIGVRLKRGAGALPHWQSAGESHKHRNRLTFSRVAMRSMARVTRCSTVMETSRRTMAAGRWGTTPAILWTDREMQGQNPVSPLVRASIVNCVWHDRHICSASQGKLWQRWSCNICTNNLAVSSNPARSLRETWGPSSVFKGKASSGETAATTQRHTVLLWNKANDSFI